MTIAGWDGTIVEPGPRRIIILFSGSIRAMRCAQSIRDALNANDLEGRFGIHSGAVGTEIAPGGATGVAVELASMAASGAIIVTESVKNISPGSGFVFEPLGKQELAASELPLDIFRLSDRQGDDTSNT
jgi:class 3 adenylate cyclase